MQNIVKIKYDKETNNIKITHFDNEMDISRIKGIPIEQWLYPFYANGVSWRGLYEELVTFTGSTDYTLRFDSDEESFNLVKHAFGKKNIKLVGTNNIVTIIYHENPFSTKITINGKPLDTALIQNRCIDEWIKPFRIREFQWNGIFTELENEVGADVYTIYFVGELEFMNILINDCPASVNIFYRDSKIVNPAIRTKTISKDDIANISETAQKKIGDIQQSFTNKNNSRGNENGLTKNSFIKKNLVTFLAVLAIILLFLPFAKFSVSSDISEIQITGNAVKASGFETIFGIDEIKIGSNKSVFALLLLITPIIIIAANYINLEFFKKKWIDTFIPLIGILAEIITLLDLRKLCKSFVIEDGVKLNTSLGLGFFLILVCYILIAIIKSTSSHGFKLPKIK